MEHRVYFLLDRSGSMIADDAIQGLNTFIKQQDPETLLTLYLFDHEFSVAFRNVPIKNVEQFTYTPRGGTALVDAIGKAISDIDDDLPHLWSDQEDIKITVVILTDGEDNASTIHTLDDTGYKISFKRMSGWDFIFAGASEQTFEIASSLSINRDSIIMFDVDDIVDTLHTIGVLVTERNAGHTTFDA